MNSDTDFPQSLFEIRNCDKTLKEYMLARSSGPFEDKHVTEFCNIILLNKKDLARREDIKKYLTRFFKKRDFICELRHFGSTINGLGFYDSDIDLYLEVSKSEKVKLNGLLYKIKGILHSSLISKLYNLNVIRAKCPIVKLTSYKEKIVEFDINVTHSTGVFNSMVLNYLVNSDNRFKELFAIVKFWAKLNDLINIGVFRSYTFALLTVFFLQNCEISFIKSLDSLYKYSQKFQDGVVPNFENELKTKCLDLLQNMDQIPSTLTLIHQFFSFYASFDFMNFVISLRLGFAVRKDHFFQLVTEFDGVESPNFRISPLICLEDPFEVERNLTAHFKEPTFEQFVRLCTWYAKQPESYFNVGSNFVKFISIPCKSVVMPVNTSKYITPCVCFSREYFNKLSLQSASTSNKEKMYNFIYEFAKLTVKSTFDHLKKMPVSGNTREKFEIVKYTLNENCFPQFNRIKVENDDEPEMNSKSLNKQCFDLGSIQIKLLNQVTQESKEKKKKKRKQNLILDGSEYMRMLYFPDEAFTSNSVDADPNDCLHPLVNATLQCRFINEKNYLFIFKYDQQPPKVLTSKLLFVANNSCKCKRKNLQKTAKQEEVDYIEIQ